MVNQIPRNFILLVLAGVVIIKLVSNPIQLFIILVCCWCILKVFRVLRGKFFVTQPPTIKHTLHQRLVFAVLMGFLIFFMIVRYDVAENHTLNIMS